MAETLHALDSADDPSSSINSLNPVIEAEYLDLEIDVEDPLIGDGEALTPILRRAVCATLAASEIEARVPVELYIRIVGAADSQQLNLEYRGKDKPTNVLSFPAIDPHEVLTACAVSASGGPPLLLGDIIISASVIADEAVAQKKTVEDHLSHMAVHGVLHLIGYDHIKDQDAVLMEDLERNILKRIGIADPYQNEFSHDG